MIYAKVLQLLYSLARSLVMSELFKALSNICKTVFRKPVTDMTELEEKIVETMSYRGKNV